MRAAVQNREGEDQDQISPGAFVAVVGPSGAGKDTLIRQARMTLGGDQRFHFVRRLVTRTAFPMTKTINRSIRPISTS